jgi:DNA anti-recombination protein RmuC
MNDNQTNSQPDPKNQPPSDVWQEVGRQFQILGETLAAAFRTSWNDEENRKRMQQMQGSLENVVHEIDLGLQNAAQSPEAQRAREEAKRAAETLRQAGEQTVQDVRPQLLTALRQVNGELQKLVNRMEHPAQQPPASADNAGSATATGEEKKP